MTQAKVLSIKRQNGGDGSHMSNWLRHSLGMHYRPFIHMPFTLAFDQGCLYVQIFHKKKSGKNLNRDVVLFTKLKNRQEVMFDVKGTKSIIQVKNIRGSRKRCMATMKIGMFLPSPTIMSSLPVWYECTSRFCKSEVI